ncbi:recombinase family protein [uncultured Clostridium sp.]|uniref:recombinase family protein n=1 Tax=uncultured Clostridium sp. TaxID=59620 RepID=UPI002582C0FA|nr:recombinase family protein [uncultured Clostridium sp.]
MNNLKALDNIIDTPKNYAAIYARISGTRDNNSISSQIQLATNALKEKNLLIYSVYTDFDSAKKLSPTKRKGLSKLLADAKAGCFKTVIIYRLDRLVRRYKDWLEIKNTFSKLGINLIYSDESQSLPRNSSQGEFFENLMVMVAEMEPDTINQRASNGRKFRRTQGAYSCGTNTPFGYLREERDESDSSKASKSIFNQEPIKLAFVKYMYLEFNSLIIQEKKSINTNKASITFIYNALEKAINYIEKHINEGEIPVHSLDKNTPIYELCSTINKYLKRKSHDFVLEGIKLVKFHYLINSKTNKKRNTNNITTCLKNSTYAGYMLEDSKHPFKGLKYITDSNETILYDERLDEKAFIKTNNLNGVIPYTIFKTVYSYLTYESLGRIDRTPDFLLKGALRCSCNKKLLLVDDIYLHCGNSKCTGFFKKDLLVFIVNEIIKDCLSNSNTTIKKFLKSLNKKTQLDTSNINSLKKKKFEAVANYINSKDESFINYIYDKKVSIDSYTGLCTQYRQKISHIDTLFEKIKFSKEYYDLYQIKDISTLYTVINKITDYILANEDIFISIFSEIIKEVKVKLNNDSSNAKGNIKIKYEFTAEKASSIH